MTALSKQEGGSHYKGYAYQPVEFGVNLNLNFIQGSIVKYITRHKSKNGAEDIHKAKHFSELGRELNPVTQDVSLTSYEEVEKYTSDRKSVV